RRRHTRFSRDWSSDVCSSDLTVVSLADGRVRFETPTEPEPDLRQLYVIRSRDHYVVIANQPPDPTGWQQVTPQTIPIHGRVYGRTEERRVGKTSVARRATHR